MSAAHEQSKQGGASKRVSSASERANGRASGPVLRPGFLVDLAHCVVELFCRSMMILQQKRKVQTQVRRQVASEGTVVAALVDCAWPHFHLLQEVGVCKCLDSCFGGGALRKTRRCDSRAHLTVFVGGWQFFGQ